MSMGGWKHHSELTLDECEAEAQSLVHYFQSCHEIGQGINTKESMRFKGCCARLRAAGRYVPETPYCLNDLGVRLPSEDDVEMFLRTLRSEKGSSR